MLRLQSRWLGALCLVVLSAGLLLAQSNTTGAVSGMVMDPSGAVVPNAVVHLDQDATNIHLKAQSNSSGGFSFPSLLPGAYKVRVEAKGFPAASQAVVVQVGQVTNVPVGLKLGAGATTVEVTGAATNVQVDTTTATVSGVVSTQQIENLPQIGRNFLDLAQLEPGVQMIDGGNFDPTKNGFAGLSVQGAEGRTTEINLNGIDITDQTVGTTTQNVSDLAIQEFQVSQSSGDTSSDIGNTGQVNITTKSGENSVHGNGFAYYRSKRFAANPTLSTEKPPFKQNQDGLALGGPVWRNHLYWYVDGERTYRDQESAVDMPDFPNYNGFFPTPGFEKLANGRFDWQVAPTMRLFYFFNHDSNELVPPSVVGGTSLSPFSNEDVTNTHVVALDWSTGRFTHQFRYGHVGFFNHIVAKPVAGVPDFPVGITFDTGEQFGPNLLAPQHTFQLSDELKYEGSAYFGNHTLRYGIEYNHIANVVYAAFFASAPVVNPVFSKGPVNGGDPLNPLDYAPQGITFGNGLGYFSNLPVHGDPFGGVYNSRKSLYLTDSWRVSPTLTFNYGVHYERDPGEVNRDLPRPSIIGAAFPTLATAAPVPSNFSPTAGIAWDPTGHGTTSIRLGAGMYYENNIWNNVLFERSNYISPSIAPGFGSAPLSDASGNCIFLCSGASATLASQSIGALAPSMLAAQSAYQASFAALPQHPLGQPSILGAGAPQAPGTNLTGSPLFDSTYRTPYSVQMNIGVEHQFGPGVVVSADFVSNRAFDLLMIQDTNRVGDAKFLNAAVATSAINGTATDLGLTPSANASATLGAIVGMMGKTCGSGCAPSLQGTPITQAIVVNELVGGTNGNGQSIGGGANSVAGSPTFAFGGINPNFGILNTDRNLGTSNYKGLQIKATIQRGAMLHWVHASSMTISYALGRLDSTQFDQSFAPFVNSQDNPRQFYGPNGYDRTHQLSIGGIFNVPGGFLLSTVNHFASGLPQTPKLAALGTGAGEIFNTDWTGSGVDLAPPGDNVNEVVPGTNLGSFNRQINTAAKLQSLIDSYNGTMAGSLTPAGQALVSAGLATQAQLQSLGMVMPFITASVAPGQLMPDSFLDTDLRISRPIHVSERFTISPHVEVFNLFNIGNYDPPGNVISGVLATGATPGAPGYHGNVDSISNTTRLNQANKFGLNTGVFAAGIPRAFQGGIRFSF